MVEHVKLALLTNCLQCGYVKKTGLETLVMMNSHQSVYRTSE